MSNPQRRWTDFEQFLKRGTTDKYVFASISQAEIDELVATGKVMVRDHQHATVISLKQVYDSRERRKAARA